MTRRVDVAARAIDRLAGDVLSLGGIGGRVEKRSIASRRSFADAQDDRKEALFVVILNEADRQGAFLCHPERGLPK